LGKQKARGKALLETAELIFRAEDGGLRLKIPFASREVGQGSEWGAAAGGSGGIRGLYFGEECREVVREDSASKNALGKIRREGE
jgi:hypothetical protein